jgi:hypothetical protein
MDLGERTEGKEEFGIENLSQLLISQELIDFGKKNEVGRVKNPNDIFQLEMNEFARRHTF